MNKDLVTYYHERALEYDKIYTRPERQEALKEVTVFFQELFENKNVFEIACGTGYWTEKIAEKAKSVLATDINEAVLDITRSRDFVKENVEVKNMDIFRVSETIKYESLFGGFIWSHILKEHINSFLKQVQKAVVKGGMVVLIDNIFVKNGSTPIAETDEYGNTYQFRSLDDGSQHRVLKNYFTEEQLRKLIEPFGTNIKYFNFKYYWILTYERL